MKESPSVNLGQGLSLSQSNGQLQIVLSNEVAPKGPRGKIHQPPGRKKTVNNSKAAVNAEKQKFDEPKDAVNIRRNEQPITKTSNIAGKRAKQPEEETVTLTKKQLDALVGTINEVCNLAAEEMDTMRLMNDAKYRSKGDNLDDSTVSADKESVHMHQNKVVNVNSQKSTPEERTRPPNRTVPARKEKTSGENIMDLLNKNKSTSHKTPVAKRGNGVGTNTTVNQKSSEKQMKENLSKTRVKQVERQHSMVSKAVSPIVVYEQVNPSKNRKSHERGNRPGRRDKSPMKKVSPSPMRRRVEHEESVDLNLTQNSTNSRDGPEEISTRSEVKPDNVSKVKVEDDATPKSNVKNEEKSKMDPPLTLLEKKRLQWDKEKRENSTLRKEMVAPEFQERKQKFDHTTPAEVKFESTSNNKTNERRNEETDGKSYSPKILSPRYVLNQPSAMLDHFQIVNETDVEVTKRQEQLRWLKELDKQKEEQKLKKMVEIELRKSFVDITPRRASTILTEVCFETEKANQENQEINKSNPQASTHDKLQKELKLKKLIQQRISTHFPSTGQPGAGHQMGSNQAVKGRPPVNPSRAMQENAGEDQIDGLNIVKSEVNREYENKITSVDGKMDGGWGPTVGGRSKNNNTNNMATSIKTSEVRESVNNDAYNSSQTHLVFHQAFEEPVPLTERPKNDFGRFKALIDPAEVERQKKERERQQQHAREVQEQIEAKRLAKEEEKRKRKEEELEDERRLMRELAQANNQNPSEYNRTRPVPKAQLEPHSVEPPPVQHPQGASNVARRVPQTVDNYYPEESGRSNHVGGAAGGNVMLSTATNVVQRQDSDVVVEYVPQDRIVAAHTATHRPNVAEVATVAGSTITSSRYVDHERGRGGTQQQQQSSRANERDIRRPDNLRQKKKEALNRHNRQFGAGAAHHDSTSNVSSRQPKQPNSSRQMPSSPPVPALQKKNLDKPAIPSRSKRAANQSAATKAGSDNYNYGGGQIPESSRTQPTIVSSRYVDPNVTSPPPVPNGDFIPFRRTSAHMDPALSSARHPPPNRNPISHQHDPHLEPHRQLPGSVQGRAPLDEDEGGSGGVVSRNRQTESAYQRQDAILKQLSTLRQGLMEKQREYNSQTPT